MSSRRRGPKHVDDQYQAAERDAAAVLAGTAARIGVPVLQAPNSDPDDPPMTEFIASLRREIEAHAWLNCEHIDEVPMQPMFVDAWDRPRVMRCRACFLNVPPLYGDADVTCDLCGKVDRTGIWPGQVAFGPLVLTFGRCDACTPPGSRPRRR